MPERRRSSRLDRTPGRALVNLAFVGGRLARKRAGRLSPGIGARWLIAFAAVLVGVAALALLLDAPSVEWAAGLPTGVRSAFEVLSDIGRSQWLLVPSGVLVIILLMGRWSGIAPWLRAAWAEIGFLAAYVFLAVGGAALVVNAFKQLIGRGRPVGYEENGAFSFDPFNFDYGNASFPSGHATTAGAFIVCGFLLFPRLRLLFLAIGLTVALSRIIVGAHFPSDVLAGLFLGAAWAMLLAGVLAWRGVAFYRRGGSFVPIAPAIRRAPRRAGWRALLAAPLQALAGPREPLN
ncbi:MAG: phosphatase PAP2 family protein [Bauldia sp.]|jgi:undecaprenyl-diphosphatase|nr:phosphatase PAP2 family protein [Bauldia sp.]